MKILDACCGSKLFWFDKNCSFADYMDIREETYEICGKKVNVKPDVVADFRNMPFKDNTYDLVVFDPPHLKWAGQKSIMKAQYGQLDKDNWTSDTKQAWQTTDELEAKRKREYYENQGYKCKFRHGVTVKHGFVDIRGHR